MLDEHARSQTPLPTSRLVLSVNILWAIWVVCQLYFAGISMPFSIDELKVFHIGFAAAILAWALFVKNYRKQHVACWFWLVIAVLAAAVTTIFLGSYDTLIEHVGTPTLEDCLLGGALVMVILLITWKEWGTIIPVVVLCIMAYGLYGQHFGGIFRHSGIEWERLIGYTSTYFMGTLGSLTSLSATMIFQFIMFGALLQCLGGFSLIEKLSKLVCRRYASGAAQTAIYSSAFIGMMTGSAAANVAVTGSFTIPMMKSRGYTADYAGAVEAVASTGGQILPPVMGVAAFIMASMVGMPYSKICIAALLPAIIYFVHLSFAVAVQSSKLGMKRYEESEDDAASLSVSIWQILKEHGHLFIPIAFLTWRIFVGDSPNKAAITSNFLMIAVALAHALLFSKGQLRASFIEVFKNVYKGLVTGANEGAKIAIVMGALGIIVDIFSTTGFGQRLSHGMLELAGGSVFILVLLAALLTLFFGMGMPTPGAYLLTILLSAPVLIKFGFPVLSVHMFVFYFAVVAAITPPVAMASLVAVGISNGSYMKTAVQAVRLGLQGFLLPVFFLIRPDTLTLETNTLVALGVNGMLLICGVGFTLLLEGHFIRRVSWAGRAICLASTAGILYPNDVLSVVGCIGILGYCTAHYLHARREAA